MSNLFGGSSTHNYPAQPTYGEGMADAMKAQMEMLTGKTLGEGEGFEELYSSALGREGGTLADILRQFEAPLRKETAQLDTDVLRQTLLGDETAQADELGRLQIGTKRVSTTGVPLDARYEIKNGNVVDLFNQTIVDPMQSTAISGGKDIDSKTLFYGDPGYEKFTKYGANALQAWAKETGRDAEKWYTQGGMWTGGYDKRGLSIIEGGSALSEAFNDGGGFGGGVKGIPTSVLNDFMSTGGVDIMNDALDEEGRSPKGTELVPEYQTDPATGAVIDDKWLVSQGRPKRAGQTVRAGVGMLDLFGPTEAGMVTKEIETDAERYGEYVKRDTELMKWWNDPNVGGDQKEMYGGDIAAFGKAHWDAFGKQEVAKGHRADGLPEIGETYQVSRRAGFDPQTDEFLGLTTLGADVSEQLARRQRAADIYDVGQLGGKATEAYRQQGVQYDPATGEAIAGTGIAGTLAEARRLGPGGAAKYSAMRTAPLFRDAAMTSLQDTAEGMRPGAYEQLRTDMPTIEAGRIGGDYRAFDPTGTGEYARSRAATQADVDAGRATAVDQTIATGGTDPLRMAMLQQVQEGLGEGLTEREQRTLREAARSRATAMGRTYDPTATICLLYTSDAADE